MGGVAGYAVEDGVLIVQATDADTATRIAEALIEAETD